jgi:zeaxanthin glucosyltransferase
MHFAIVSPPVSGHIHPFGALGRELIERGHRVTVLHMADVEPKARAEGLDFIAIGQSDHPPGFLASSLAKLASVRGWAALRFTIAEIRGTTEMFCRDLPMRLSKAGIDALLVDQTEPAGGTVAEHLGIPFITICNALPLNREPDIPPPFTNWSYRASLAARIRNAVGYGVSERLMRPVTETIKRYRKQWDLASHASPEESFSPRAQISQLPSGFDFPRRSLPKQFHYVGPFRKSDQRLVPFPWEKLDGRPVIYASLGTLQNRNKALFQCFAEACDGLKEQLVITHGGGLDAPAAASLPGKPIVVPYAPQLEILKRARLTLTHAGLNTVLDSLRQGVPLVAVPITFEQPGIASRIRWSGVGVDLHYSKVTVSRLAKAVRLVLSDDSYSAQAKKMSVSIKQSGEVGTAADLVLQAVSNPA